MTPIVLVPPREGDLGAENAALWEFVAAIDADLAKGGHVTRGDVQSARAKLRKATRK